MAVAGLRQPAVAGRFYTDDPDALEDRLSVVRRHRDLGQGGDRTSGALQVTRVGVYGRDQLRAEVHARQGRI